MEHRAAFQREDAVGERQHEIEVVLDDRDGDVLLEPVEHLEQFEDHGRRQSLEGFVEQQELDVARHRARHSHHLLIAAGEIIRRYFVISTEM
jgi:hypothetical protein